MGIFGRGLSVDTNGNAQAPPSRNRRNSSITTSVPVTIVPAPLLQSQFVKTSNLATSSANTSNVFGRQHSWSDQMADASILKNNSSTIANTNSGNSSLLSNNNNNNNNSNYHSSISNSSYGGNNNNLSADVKFVHSTMEILENQIKREEAPKKKRTRTSTEQLRILQKAFQTDPMPNSSARMILSKKLGMSSRAVQVWFQNRRAKDKLDAKRSETGHGSSSFNYVNGDRSDDEEEIIDEGGQNEDEDGDFNFDAEDSSAIGSIASVESFSSSGNLKSGAAGMMGRFAFSNSMPGMVKAQRSSSTPNGYFHGFPQGSSSNSNPLKGRNVQQMQMNSNQNRYNQINLNSNKNGQIFNGNSNNINTSTPFLLNSQNSSLSTTINNTSNPICHLFPGESFISDVTEASVDQLYQDLGGSTGSLPSPIDDHCAVLSGSGNGFFNQITSTSSLAINSTLLQGQNFNNNNHFSNNLHMMSAGYNQTTPTSSSSSSSTTTAAATGSGSGSNYFTFGDPFYGGGLIDRTPSVSPVGFGPRSYFYALNNSNSNYEFMLPSLGNSENNNNFYVAGNNNLNSDHQQKQITSFNELSTTSTNNNNNNNNPNNNSPNLNPNSNNSFACKGVSGGNVYLTSSIGPIQNQTSTSTSTSNSRRSFSLPEAHGNLTFQQLQQLENFGLQVFPSPLLSINEDVGSGACSGIGNGIDGDGDGEGQFQFLNLNKNISLTLNNKNNSTDSSNDFLIPFSDFLEGEVIR